MIRDASPIVCRGICGFAATICGDGGVVGAELQQVLLGNPLLRDEPTDHLRDRAVATRCWANVCSRQMVWGGIRRFRVALKMGAGQGD